MDLDRLIDALIQVESGGKADAVGDNGKALGILQIHDAVIQDVNRVSTYRFVHADALNPSAAKQICANYLRYWGKQCEKSLGRPANYEELARIWNGGPNGYLKDATLGYWKKVCLTLASLPEADQPTNIKKRTFLFTYEANDSLNTWKGNIAGDTTRLNQQTIVDIQKAAAAEILKTHGVSVSSSTVLITFVIELED